MKTIPEIIDMIEAWHIAETEVPDQHGLLAEIEYAIREIAQPAQENAAQPCGTSDPVHLVAHHPAPGQRHDWREVSADRFQKFIDGGFVTRTLYTSPQQGQNAAQPNKDADWELVGEVAMHRNYSAVVHWKSVMPISGTKLYARAAIAAQPAKASE